MTINSPSRKANEGALHPLSSIESDWFAPALAEDQTVASSFDAVIVLAKRRLEFTQALRQKLCRPGMMSSDALSELIIDCRRLQTSLKSRLGILDPSRHAAWFRESSSVSTGPFASSAQRDPVLPHYHFEEIDAVIQGIQSVWKSGSTEWPKPGPSLWHCLFALNGRWHQLVDMRYGVHQFSLLEDLSQLDPSLRSPILVGFLNSIQKRIKEARGLLDEMYAELLERCQRLWDDQKTSPRRSATRLDQEQPKTQQSYRVRAQADHIRDEMRRRRQVVPPLQTLNQSIRSAMKVMGFADLPGIEDLRARYRVMARQLHPDVNLGEEDEFKRLVQAYQVLQSKLGLRKNRAEV